MHWLRRAKRGCLMPESLDRSPRGMRLRLVILYTCGLQLGRICPILRRCHSPPGDEPRNRVPPFTLMKTPDQSPTSSAVEDAPIPGRSHLSRCDSLRVFSDVLCKASVAPTAFNLSPCSDTASTGCAHQVAMQIHPYDIFNSHSQ